MKSDLKFLSLGGAKIRYFPPLDFEILVFPPLGFPPLLKTLLTALLENQSAADLILQNYNL